MAEACAGTCSSRQASEVLYLISPPISPYLPISPPYLHLQQQGERGRQQLDRVRLDARPDALTG